MLGYVLVRGGEYCVLNDAAGARRGRVLVGMKFPLGGTGKSSSRGRVVSFCASEDEASGRRPGAGHDAGELVADQLRASAPGEVFGVVDHADVFAAGRSGEVCVRLYVSVIFQSCDREQP